MSERMHGSGSDNDRLPGAPAARSAAPVASGPAVAAAYAQRLAMNDASVLGLQQAGGNRAVTSLLRQQGAVPAAPGAGGDESEWVVISDEFVPDPGQGMPDIAAPISVSFSDGGMVGTAPFGGSADPAHLNCPHAFIDGGMTSTVAWSGGGGAGAHGNEGTGTLQTQIVPTYTGSAGPTAGKFSSRVNPGTGILSVTRSWVGAFSGDQGNGWYLTAASVATINSHERHHVAATQALYGTHLTPLEARVANVALGVDAGPTAVGAIAAHTAAINWAPTIVAFQTADTAANKAPNGTVDTADVAAGWIVDLGPGSVGGTAFTHRIVNDGEAAPAP